VTSFPDAHRAISGRIELGGQAAADSRIWFVALMPLAPARPG